MLLTFLFSILSVTPPKISSNIEADTIGELLQMEIPAQIKKQNAYVSGHSSRNDGGGGEFIYDWASSVPTNLGTIFKPVNSNGRWLRQYSSPIDIRWFGAFSDSQKPCAEQLQSAIDYLYSTGGGKIIIPPGQYRVESTITIPSLISIIGSGLDTTTLYCSANIDSAINIVGTPTKPRVKISLQDFSIHALSPTNNIGISLAYFINSSIKNVRVRSFNTGIFIENSWGSSFVEVVTDSNQQDGFRLGRDANHLKFQMCSANSNKRAGLSSSGSRAVNIDSCNFEANEFGIYLNSESGLPTKAVTILGCYLEGNLSHDILIAPDLAKKHRGINLLGNYFLPLHDEIHSVQAHNVDGFCAMGNTFDDVGKFNHKYSFYFPDSGAVQNVWLGANSDMSDNGVHRNRTMEVNYLDRLRVSAHWNPPPLDPNSFTSTNITVNGVKMGMPSIVAFSSKIPAGSHMYANVTSTDTITVTLVNSTSSHVDLDAGALNITVHQR